jgi:hypothetical protein
MTRNEFNEKYKDYLVEGYYGLEFDIPSVTKFLDSIFEDLVWIPAFSYSQIKLKFNMARFYAKVGLGLQSLIESYIDHLVAKHDAERLVASTTTTNSTTHG